MTYGEEGLGEEGGDIGTEPIAMRAVRDVQNIKYCSTVLIV